jgi:HEAT repeat protein
LGCTPSSPEAQIKKEAIRLLEGSLRHENFFVRSAAIKAIGEMGDPAHIPLILPGFKDSASFVRLFSVESVTALHGRDTIKLLLAASSDPDPMVRVAVVKGLNDLLDAEGKVDGFPIEKLVAPLLKDADPTVRLFAFASLARRGDKNALAEIEKGIAVEDTVQSAVVALGRTKQKEAIPLLDKTLDHPDELVRILSAEAIGEVGAKEGLAVLTRKATDFSGGVRGAVATSFGKIGDPEAIPTLNRLLEDAELSVQLSAAEGLTRLGKPQLAIYEKGLAQTDYGVRHFVISSLHKAAGKEAMPLLTKALSDQAPRVRIAAVRAIGSIGKKEDAVPLLKERMNDTDMSVRAYAAGNIVRLLQVAVKPTKRHTGE